MPPDAGRAPDVPSIEAVVFDLGGVCIDWDPRHLYRKLFDGDDAAMERFLTEVCSPDWNAQLDGGRSWTEAVESLSREHPDARDLIEAFRERWVEMLGGAIDETVAVLDRLREARIPIFALSNWSAETYPIARRFFPFLEWFRGVVISGEVGIRKPDPRIFRLLLERYDLAPATTLFVDDVAENVAAAEALGLVGLLFRDGPGLRRDLRRLGLLAGSSAGRGEPSSSADRLGRRTGAYAGTLGVSGETPELSGGIGGGAGPGGGSAAGGVGAGGAGGVGGAGVGGAGAGGVGGGGTGGFAGIAGSHVLPVLIAGGLTGVIAMGALIAFNVVPVHSGGSGASPRGLVLVACPGTGPVLAVVDPGQHLLVTGRSSDGSWLQVYLPGPALPYAWAPADQLQPSGDTGTLPVAACEIAAASPSGTPIEATVSPSESTSPSPTPTPTPVANTGPKLERLVASSGTIYLPAAATGCTQSPASVTIAVSASDPDGVASVNLFWRVSGNAYTRARMTHGSGSTWSVQLFAQGDVKTTGTVSYYVLATDASAAALTRRLPTGDATFIVKKCDLPPTVSDSNISVGQSGVFYVPTKSVIPAIQTCAGLKPGTNQYSITAYVSDPDDSVAKVVFWYTPYGGTLKSLALAHVSGNQWHATLTNAKFAKLSTVGPHPFSWYFVATDAAGRSSPHQPHPVSPLSEQGCSP